MDAIHDGDDGANGSSTFPSSQPTTTMPQSQHSAVANEKTDGEYHVADDVHQQRDLLQFVAALSAASDSIEMQMITNRHVSF